MAIEDGVKVNINAKYKCHACDGKGWVDSKYIGACKCPVCGGTGEAPKAMQNPDPMLPVPPTWPWYPSQPVEPWKRPNFFDSAIIYCRGGI